MGNKRLLLVIFFSIILLMLISFTSSYTFSPTTLSSDIAMAPLTNTTFVVAWVDVNETDISFKIMDTNGSTILNTIDVDTTASEVYSRVSVANINSTRFVIAYANTTNNVFRIYNTDGTSVLGPIVISTTEGSSSVAPDISVAELGNRFAIAYTLPSLKDLYSNLYHNNGTIIASPLQIDVSVGANSPLWNTLDLVGLNNGMYVYVRHDAGPSDIFIGGINGTTNTYVISETTEDSNAGTSAQVGITSLDNNKFVTFWYDSDNSLIEYSIRYSNESIIMPPTTVTSVGTSSRIGITTIRKNSTTTADLFVLAWTNQTSNNIWAAVYNGSGTQITAPFIMATDKSPTYQLFDIAGRDPVTNDTLYPGTFTLAYTNNSGSVFKSFYSNGTIWNGILPTTPPLTWNLNISITNSSGVKLNTTCVIINSTGSVIHNHTGTSHSDNLPPGIYEMILSPINKSFKEIRFQGINVSQNITQLIDIESPANHFTYNELNSFNPLLPASTQIENVTNLTLTFTATNTTNNKILYKCADWNWTNQNCSGTWMPIRGISPGEDYTYFTDNLTDPAIAEGNGTFFEGFEGAQADNQSNVGYDNPGWRIIGGGTWNPNDKDEFAGADSLGVKNTGGVFSWAEINVSTQNYTNIILTTYYKDSNNFEVGEYLTIGWHNGTNWINLLNVSNIATYTLFNQTLSSSANNNPNLKIRLGCKVDAPNEACNWDNVQITGTLLVTNTCTYSGLGNWNILCSDNCTITTPTNIQGNNVSIIGAGTFTTTANITNFKTLSVRGTSSVNRCNVYCLNGGCFKS